MFAGIFGFISIMTTGVHAGLNIVPPLKNLVVGEAGSVLISPQVELKFEYPNEESVHVNDKEFQDAFSSVLQRIRGCASGSDGGFIYITVCYEGDLIEVGYPSLKTDESYELEWGSDSIIVTGRSFSGVLYGLETLSQIMFTNGGVLPYVSGLVRDGPKYVHRGLLADSGRRFWPMRLLIETIEAMSVVKMNVLHFHFTDNCRFSIESETHPELKPLDDQFLTKNEVKILIEFATKHGVRIVPEIDIPGHARGMREGFGVTWADENRVQMTDSVGTREFLTDILSEFAELFPDEYFHIGADETRNAPKELLNFAVELLKSFGKKTIGWEELYFTTEAGNPEDVSIQIWKSRKVTETANAGFTSIVSRYTNWYLDLRPLNKKMWVDINPGGSFGVLGGEVAMWTDFYCPIGDCYVEARLTPPARELYPQARDLEFIESIHRMVWTKSAIAASALWNYQTSPPTDLNLQNVKKYLHTNFGIKGCIDIEGQCRCSELTGCDDVSLPAISPHFQSLPSLLPPITLHVPSPQTLEPVHYLGGMFLTRATSFLGQMSILPIKHLITGDVSIYYVDAFYSQPAFVYMDPIEVFLREFRAQIGPNPTISFIFDDGGKNDPFLFGEYLEKFAKWEARIVDRTRLGKIGVGLNVEDLSANQIHPYINKMHISERNELTKFQLVLYGDTVQHALVTLGLASADSILVHVGGSDIVSNIITWIQQHATVLLANESETYIMFAVKSNAIHAQTLFDQIPPTLQNFFNIETLIMVHPWEIYMQ